MHRHSNSATATISLSLGDSQVRLKIADQGKGMAATSAESGDQRRSGGVGLSGIRERVANLGGHMQIAVAIGAPPSKSFSPVPK